MELAITGWVEFKIGLFGGLIVRLNGCDTGNAAEAGSVGYVQFGVKDLLIMPQVNPCLSYVRSKTPELRFVIKPIFQLSIDLKLKGKHTKIFGYLGS